MYVFVAGLLILSLLLFQALESRRTSRLAPAPRATSPDLSVRSRIIPQLYIPREDGPPDYYLQRTPPRFGSALAGPVYVRRAAPQASTRAPYDGGRFEPEPRAGSRPAAPFPSSVPNGSPLDPPAYDPAQGAGNRAGPTVVLDTGSARSNPPDPGAGQQATPSPQAAATGRPVPRARASYLGNPAATVPQGSVIAAVLESRIDTTRPGPVRAIVSYDVRGFDGSRVLIPRGSRLYGEYAANLEPGQNRAAILWTRLMRPDGVQIAINSPASDALGRAGVGGKVDNKFWQQLLSGLLQTTLNVGASLATQGINDGGTIILPGALNVGTQQTNQQRVVPTLRVEPGASIAVFVNRDLDFSGVRTGE